MNNSEKTFMKIRFLLKILLISLPFSGIAQTLEWLNPVVQVVSNNGAAYVVNNRLVALSYGSGEFVITSTDGTKNGSVILLDGDTVHGLNNRSGTPLSGIDRLNFARFFHYASNSGKLLYFFIPDAISSTNRRYTLWCTDGTKDGTYKLDFTVEATSLPFFLVRSLIGDDLLHTKTVGTDNVTYLISGKDKTVKEFKRNASVIPLNSDNVMIREYTRNTDNTITYSTDIKILNPKTGQERILQLPDARIVDVLFTDTAYAYINAYLQDSRRLVEVNLATLQTKILFETNKLSSAGPDGFDSIQGLDKANGNVIFTLSNQKAGNPVTYEAWGYKEGQSEARRITALPGHMKQRVFFKNRWFFTAQVYNGNALSGDRLFSSDGTPAGTEVLAEYPDSDAFYDETRGRIPVPGFQEVNGNLLYFFRTANAGTQQNDYTIYQIDGATLKPRIFMDNLTGFSSFHKMGDKYYFTDSRYIYESDGTPGGSKKLMTCPGYVDNRFDNPTNLRAVKNRVFVGTIFSLSDKLIFNMGALPSFNQIATVMNSKEPVAYKGYSEMRNFDSINNNSFLWGFDPAAAPFSCESAIPNMRLNCIGEPTVQGFLQYPDSKIEWYFNNTLVPGSAGADTLKVEESGKYKLKVSYKNCESFSNELEYKVDAPKVTLTKGEGGSQNGFFFKATIPEGRTRTKIEVIYKGSVVATTPPADYINVPNSSPGLYTIRITDSQGCIGEASIQMGEDVNNNITASISTSVPSPSASPITLYANTGTGYTYQWRKDGVDIPGATGQQYVATVSGVYTVVVKAFGQTAVSSPAYITITTSGTSLTATISSTATTAYAPQTITLTANSGTGYTYQWRRNGTNIPGATGATYEAKESGTYTVVITANGQSVTSNNIVLVIQVPLAREPEVSGIAVSIFPNPVDRQVNAEIRLSEELPVRVDIYTADGRRVKQWHSESKNFVHRPEIVLGNGLEGQQLLLKVSTDKSFVTKKILVK